MFVNNHKSYSQIGFCGRNSSRCEARRAELIYILIIVYKLGIYEDLFHSPIVPYVQFLNGNHLL